MGGVEREKRYSFICVKLYIEKLDIAYEPAIKYASFHIQQGN